MKKLLFVGALLVLGATSFGAVSAIFKNTSGAEQGSNLSAEATLNLSSRGNVIDSTNRAVLVVTPIGTEGADGETLTFNFGDIMKNSTQTLTGRFTAEIIADDKNMNFPDGQPTVKLEKSSGATGSPTVEDNSITGIEVADTADGTSQIGTLAYKLQGVMTNPQKYTGTITSSFTAEKDGTFVDRSAQVSVAVTGLTYNKSS